MAKEAKLICAEEVESAELRCMSAEERQRYFERLCQMDDQEFQELWDGSEVCAKLRKFAERMTGKGNMDGDLVSRRALIEEFEWLKSVTNESSKAEVEEVIQRIRNAPAVVVRPVGYGR